jgi:hypothetical protein
MHVDESTNSIPPNELDSKSASGRTSAIADALSAESARSRERAAPGQQPYSAPQDQPHFAASVAVYCGSEEAVALGFRMALSAMAAATFEETAELRGAKP